MKGGVGLRLEGWYDEGWGNWDGDRMAGCGGRTNRDRSPVLLSLQSPLLPLPTALCHPRHPQALMNAYILEFRPSSNMPFSFCNKPGLPVSGDLA